MSEGEHSTGRRVMRDLPLTRLLPNVLTLMSLCSGLTAIRFALEQHWHEAALAICIAAVFDILDGRVARMLNVTSKFGAELDSLSDLISFGVAPAFIVYEWCLVDTARLGWIAVLLYAVCGALRLARFNIMLDVPNAPAWTKSYFTGVPIPAGAGLILWPLFGFLEFGDVMKPPATLMSLWLIIVGALMVSRLPTIALKGWRVPPMWVVPIFVLVVALIAAIITSPWLALFAVATLYFVGLPLGWLSYRRKMKMEGSPNGQ